MTKNLEFLGADDSDISSAQVKPMAELNGWRAVFYATTIGFGFPARVSGRGY